MNFQSDYSLRNKDLANFGYQRARDAAFEAIHSLWRRRKAEGMKQKDLAARIGRDAGWVSNSLRGPGNWTMRTLGELAVGLGGEVEVSVPGLEDPIASPGNYDAYLGYRPLQPVLHPQTVSGNSAVIIKFEPANAS